MTPEWSWFQRLSLLSLSLILISFYNIIKLPDKPVPPPDLVWVHRHFLFEPTALIFLPIFVTKLSEVNSPGWTPFTLWFWVRTSWYLLIDTGDSWPPGVVRWRDATLSRLQKKGLFAAWLWVGQILTGGVKRKEQVRCFFFFFSRAWGLYSCKPFVAYQEFQGHNQINSTLCPSDFSFSNHILNLEDSAVDISGSIPELRGHAICDRTSKMYSNLNKINRSSWESKAISSLA